jgi:hypothetical protein
MSLILGIYSKNDKICNRDIAKVLKDFSLHGKRKLQTKCDKKILLATAGARIACNNIVENEDESLVILFGGEVYDFNDRIGDLVKRGHKFRNKKNCAEFILHSYEEFGKSFLKEINGVFCFAIYNRLNNELILANDSFGFYPLFIYTSEEYIIFSSEYEPITKYEKFDKKLNYDAIAEYFSLGLPLGDKTFFKAINNLHPGSLLRLRKNKVDFKQYDDLNIKIKKNKNITFFTKEIPKYIYKAVQARVKSPESIRCALTGGVDTRLILGNLTKSQRESIEFFTKRSHELSDDENQEIIIAKMLAKKFNLKHVIEKGYTGQVKDFGISFFERRRLEYPHKKVITGNFGGEFLGGSCFVSSSINLEEVNKGIVETRLKAVFSKNFLKDISNPYLSLKKELKNIKAENKEFLFDIYQVTRGFFTNRFGGSRAGWLDAYRRATKFGSVFWDKNLLKFLLTVPKKYIMDRKLYGQIYKNNFSHLLEIPTTREDMNPITWGKHPYNYTKPKYSRALKAYIRSHHTWDKKFYNVRYIKSKSNQEAYNVIKQFIDFEAWYRVFVLNSH